MKPSGWRTGIYGVFRDGPEIYARPIAVLW
jgi:hypothetical protein